jgi:LruC domain-containing protein
MKKTLLITALFGLFAVVSCKKSSDSPNINTGTTTLNDVKVPAGFSWASSRNLNVTVNITDNRFQNAIYKISIYTNDPLASVQQPISQGSATLQSAFSTKLYLSNQITQVYVEKTAPDKSSIVEKVQVGTADVNLTIGSTDPGFVTSSTKSSSQQVFDSAPASPDCNSGCTLPVITASTSNIDVNNGDVLCITGSNITVNFRNVNGGTIRICGANVTVQNLNLAGSTTLLVATSGSVNLSSLNFNSSAASIVNWGTINFAGSFPDNGIFSNYGIFNTSGDFNLNGQAGLFNNSGTMTVSGNFQDGTSAVATNSGSLTVSGSFQPNGGSAFVNNCSLTVGGNYNQSSGVKNYSLIKVGGTSTINGSSELGLYNSAMLKTANLIVDGSIVGYGSTSLVKITGTTSIMNQGSIISNVQVYALNAIDPTSAGKITGGATQGSSVYIPTSGCNSEGNGTPVIADADGDGVADNLDAYPNDPTKAYNITGATGTVAFEDQWPSKGDFDLNDVVMAYNYTIVTSAKNAVVQVTGNYTLLATGGNNGNAFGVEFPVSATSVSGLTLTNSSGTTASASFEAGQSNAVVFLFSNMRSEMATWNTKPGDVITAPKTYSITFNVANGPNIQTFGLDEYNPFIWNTTRGREVHVVGKTPTTLVDASLFGTQDDNTSVAASRYYVTKANLPYAINVPIVPFSYPTEGTDITQAYLHFGDWAASGGVSYTDWYSNTATGYRNAANIFTK